MSVPNEYGLPPLTEAPRLETSTTLPSTVTWGPLLESITGTGRSRLATLRAFTILAVTGVTAVQQVSDSSEPASAGGEPPAWVSALSVGPVPRVHRSAQEPSPVAELRALTGLSVAQLAQVFDVTRATVYAWERGTLPRGEREAHLLEALSFARSASRQFPEARALKQWLMTPVGPETPLQLMAQRRWRPLRGLLAQARASASTLRTPQPLQGRARALEHAELRQALRNLSPPPAHEDLESDEETTGEPSAEA